MNIKTALKASVAAAALFAIAAPAHAGSVVNGSDNISLKLSGQVNKAFVVGNDGSSNRGQIVDNDISDSRFYLTYGGSVNESVGIRGRFEVKLNDNNMSSSGIRDSASSGSAGNALDGGDDETVTLSEQWIAFDHKQMGTFQIGKLEEASDRAWTNGYNPAGNSTDAGSSIVDWDVKTSTAVDGVYSGLVVSDFFATFEGSGGANMIGYVTPTIGGAKLLLSYANDSDVDVGLAYAGKFGSFATDIYAGYKNSRGSSTSIDSVFGVSGGVKHDSGFSLSGGYGKTNLTVTTSTTADPTGYWLIGGYEASLTSMGKTGFAVTYLSNEDTTVKDDEGQVIGVGVNQGLASGVDVYASYHNITMDRSGTNYDDISLALAGIKVKF